MSPAGRGLSGMLAGRYNSFFNSTAEWIGEFLVIQGWLAPGFTARLVPLDTAEWDFPGLFFAPVVLVDRWNMAGWHVIPRSVPVLGSSLVFLIAARLFVVRRAYLQPRNLVLGVFKRLDRAFHALNENRVTKGIVLVDDTSSLPDDEPVAWRETTKRSLGTVRYLVRIFVVAEFPVLVVCLLLSLGGTGNSYGYYRNYGNEAVSAMLFCLWPIMALLVCVKAATLISGERSHETLDVLLAAPMSAASLVRQKFRGVRRLMFVLAVPLMTIVCFQTWWRSSTSSLEALWDADGPLLYFTAASLSVVVYLPLVAWTSFHIGLRVRSQSRAIFAALAVIVAWCIIPIVVAATMSEIFDLYRHSMLDYGFLLSPAAVIPYSEFSELDQFNETPWLAMIVNFMGYGSALFAIRWFTLCSAARSLGRAETSPSPAGKNNGRRR